MGIWEQAKLRVSLALHLAQKEKDIYEFLMLAVWKTYMKRANGSKLFNRTVIHEFSQKQSASSRYILQAADCFLKFGSNERVSFDS